MKTLKSVLTQVYKLQKQTLTQIYFCISSLEKDNNYPDAISVTVSSEDKDCQSFTFYDNDERNMTTYLRLTTTINTLLS